MYEQESEKYYALVVDSGAIIKQSGFSTLHNAAQSYFTTPGVMDEIRDAKARQHLDSLPFELQVREPSADGIGRVIEFSKKTGDYHTLSLVDLQVLALLYDLEREGCNNNISHVRTQPKRIVGVGKVTTLSGVLRKTKGEDGKPTSRLELNSLESKEEQYVDNTGLSFFQATVDQEVMDFSEDDEYLMDNGVDTDLSGRNCLKSENNIKQTTDEDDNVQSLKAPPSKTWAMVVNPGATSSAAHSGPNITIAEKMKQMNISIQPETTKTTKLIEEDRESLGGQFSDAEDDEDTSLHRYPKAQCSGQFRGEGEVDDDSEKYAQSGYEISDEECEAYILDSDEIEFKPNSNKYCIEQVNVKAREEDFPTLNVPIIDSFDEDAVKIRREKLEKAEADEALRKAEALKPIISKDGKLYPSFKKYKNLISDYGAKTTNRSGCGNVSNAEIKGHSIEQREPGCSNNMVDSTGGTHSRIIGGFETSGQGKEVEDDGEGWVTSMKEIQSLKTVGGLDLLKRSGRSQSADNVVSTEKPSRSQRAACATTDFAMQNVILQMNMELLTVDGLSVRKLKSWVMRCAACFMVYTGNEDQGAKLFCGRCGSAALQRIAATVDGNTGRLRLHLKKNYRHCLRGTQYNLPMPGKGNRFMGDLLLREDQLMYGAWNQRLKATRNQKESQSLFGADITSSVGFQTDITKRNDIKVGFGRKNPNASKFGREKRGKKKSSVDKVCALRRY